MTPTIQTYTGRLFSLARPCAADVHIDDVLIPLTRLCRFTGHTLESSWTVAQHTLLCDDLRAPDTDPQTRLAILLHDAAEAYIGDISRPLKALLGPAVRNVEAQVAAAIFKAFDADEVFLDEGEIKRVDDLALVTEKAMLLADSPEWPGLPRDTTRSCIALSRVSKLPCVFTELANRLVETMKAAECSPLPTLGL
ncbi:hypothetical protein [Roseomonas sp. USHLN139]|uniref:hypothetical protein n=1 Tax=Roseomonas sp. USHLN139 TaxID=3081298 RepID=UPI003B013BC3